jgi:hypothetical protein
VLTTYAYQFIKSYILHCYDNKIEFPNINEYFVRFVFKVFCIEAPRGRALTDENQKIFDTLTEFYNAKFANANIKKVDGANLDCVIGYSITEMITAIKNNIMLRFISRVNGYVNKSFKPYINEEISKLEDNINKKKHNKKDKQKQICDKRKELKEEIKLIKSDLLDNNEQLISNKKFHEWILKERSSLFPKEYNTSYAYDVHLNPLKYLKHTIYIAKTLEAKEIKSFNILPLRRSFVEKSIVIDTSSVVKLIPTKNKKQNLLDNIMEKTELIWSSVFRTELKIFRKFNKNKNCPYQFDYYIVTNGYEVGIRYIKKECVKSKNEQKLKMSEGRKKAFKEKKICKEEKKEYVIKEKRVQNKKEPKPKPKQKPKKKTQKIKKVGKTEIRYVEDLTKEERDRLLKEKKAYFDPGVIRILTGVDDNNKVFKYSCSQRLHETKRLLYQEKTETYKRDNDLDKMEKELKEYNSKTCDMTKFMEYVCKKNENMNAVGELYNSEKAKFKQYEWYASINRQRSENKLIENIKKTYGEDVILIIGDWDKKNMPIKRISTPGASILRLLSEHFEVYLVNEYNTSKLCYVTEEETENLVIRKSEAITLEDQEESKKLHSVLTYKMENNRMGCINRDINGAKNMRKVVLHILETGERPEKYRKKIVTLK